MKVRILRSLVYSDFGGDKVGARRREAGEVVVFPAWYAESIVASGHAVPFTEPDVTGEVEVEIPFTDEPEAKPKRKRRQKKE